MEVGLNFKAFRTALQGSSACKNQGSCQKRQRAEHRMT